MIKSVVLSMEVSWPNRGRKAVTAKRLGAGAAEGMASASRDRPAREEAGGVATDCNKSAAGRDK